MIRTLQAAVAVGILALGSTYGGEPKLCKDTPDRCAHQIREALSSTRYLGIRIRESRWGIEVQVVDEDSPASRAGLKTDDRIIGINGRDVTKANMRQFKEILAAAKATGRVRLAVVRVGSVRWVHARVPEMSKEQVEKVIATHLKKAHSLENAN